MRPVDTQDNGFLYLHFYKNKGLSYIFTQKVEKVINKMLDMP